MNINLLNEIYKFFDCNPPKDSRNIFLDLSKAVEREWHDGLIYKIKHIGITGDSVKLIESFLSNKFQQGVLNGQSSSWTLVSGDCKHLFFLSKSQQLFEPGKRTFIFALVSLTIFVVLHIH